MIFQCMYLFTEKVYCHFLYKHENNSSLWTYHTRDSFAMTYKIFVLTPSLTLHNLGCRTTSIHSMCRNKILTIWRPTQSENMSCTTTLKAITVYSWSPELMQCSGSMNSQKNCENPILSYFQVTDKLRHEMLALMSQSKFLQL
jgi:hypothetical protein